MVDQLRIQDLCEIPCPFRISCTGKTKQLESELVPASGFYKKTEYSKTLTHCFNEDACLGGKEASCKEGYVGFICG